jgi:hypothetical protein
MHVEITTDLAKLKYEKQRGNLTKACKVKTKRKGMQATWVQLLWACFTAI